MSLGEQLKRLGPGLITGAADDDPSGIATYSQAGAQFGPTLLWTLVFSYPFMVAVQMLSARIGRVTGRGLIHSLGATLPRWVVLGLAALLFVANTINVGADLAAMGEAAALLAGRAQLAFTVAFALASLILQLWIPYHRYADYLRWLTLVLLSYVALLFMVKIDWATVAIGMLVPRLSSRDATTTIVAIFGTTISPYLFVWQASQEVEEIHRVPERKPLKQAPSQGEDALVRIRWDAFVGMAVSNIVGLAIMLGTAATLHAAGQVNIASAADAAKALQPVAGNLAFAIFSLGIIGTGMLAVPVLAGSSAYAICEIGGWRASLEHRPMRAKAFYAVIALGVVLGLSIEWTPLSPIKALFWSAVVNGIVAVPVLAGMMVAVSRRSVMADYTAPLALKVLGWLTTFLMGATALAMVIF
ncbi:NRAMP family divalent metal transporter [Kaistia nematophila]|uniref:Divalent metal cation transporter n=1 Tax=Kaistia nematophila TaxID=2994654 RepID=A0A9X3IML0_9HYPH|nr:divalent metal cation transporter [Kaistia nematophila]MCX5570651.1 divalent metal cation transporter [Kaistia nematophila]